jgi:hypothetical protein
VNFVDPEGRQPRPNVARYTPNVQVRDVGTLIQYQIARNAFEKLQRVDPSARPDYHIGRASAQYYAQQAAFYNSAREARTMVGIGTGGQSPAGQTFAGGQIQSLLANATPQRIPVTTKQSTGSSTSQFISSGSAIDALRSVVGNNYTRDASGSYVARGIDIGGGYTANINVHRGASRERTGFVLEGQVSPGQQVGTRIQQVYRFKVEYEVE